MRTRLKPRNIALLLIAPLLLASCGDDPEMVRKRDEQRAEIQKLKGELEVLSEQLANLPEDRSAEVKELQERIRAEEAETSDLEKELAELNAKKREMQKEFESYKRKYRVD